MTPRPAYPDNIEHLDRVVADLVRDAADHGAENVVISAAGLAAEVDRMGRAAIYSAGYGAWWDRTYSSVEWVKWDGLHIDAEEYLEERAERIDTEEDTDG